MHGNSLRKIKFVPYFSTVHQILCITAVDFNRKTIYGFVELHILPLANVISKICINCKQSKIYRVCIKGQGLESWLEATFFTEISDRNISGKDARWSLGEFTENVKNVVHKTEPENSGGEITVRLPSETMQLIEEKKILRLSIEFALENPESGLHFVIPPGTGSPIQKSCHVFNYKWGNSSRLWFPCIDSLSEVCTWKIEVTVDTGFEVVCPGDLTEKVCTPDEKRVTHHFTVSTPTTASNIGMAIGNFDVHCDPEMSDVTFFCLNEMKPLLINTVSFLNEAFDFLEESLNMQYPHSSFKLVFVDEAFEEVQVFQSMAILNISLLHSVSIIEQPFITRKILVECLVQQFFGMFVCAQTWADIWLIRGITLYLTGLFIKKIFGNNEYRHWLMKEMQSLCTYELDGPTLPPLYPLPLMSVSLDNKSDVNKQEYNAHAQNTSLQQHPHLVSSAQLKMMETKSHLVMRMIELRIGQDLLLQTFNKVLSLTSAAATKRSDSLQWHSMMLSTVGFLKTISTVSGKDIKVFVDKWICHTGVAKFNGSFSFNRKRNIIELEINQFDGRGCQKYVGPLTVCIQELDGSFSHTVQVEESPSHHELPCHSKSRRNKKKKIPLVTGEEVDMDLTATFDTDSPVLWVRLDPDMTWARRVILEQPDYMWQYQLRYERDIISQVEAVIALEKYPCVGARNALIDIINQTEAFYKVRMEAVYCLAKIAVAEMEVWDGEKEIIGIFNRIFGSKACPSIPKYNEYSNYVNYFLQKTIPIAISQIQRSNGNCSKQVIAFIQNLIKYRDNRFNQYSDGYYITALIEALANTVGTALVNDEENSLSSLPIQTEAKVVLVEINRHLNMEKLLPSYKYSVSSSCLKAIRRLQVNHHIPAESEIFRKYTQYGLYEEIRLTALQILVDFVHLHSSKRDLEWLLMFIECEPVPRVRHSVVRYLIKTPPFKKRAINSQLNNMDIVKHFWKIMSSTHDFRVRSDMMNLYNMLWGTSTPSCVPAREETSAASRPDNQKMQSFEMNQETEFVSYPGTPLSMCSENSANNKIKLKIKIAGEENNQDSESEIAPFKTLPTNSSDPLALMDTETAMSKRMKKKKKKKHRHKDKKDRGKDTLDFSNSQIPGVHRDLLDDRLAAHSPLTTIGSEPIEHHTELDLMGDTFKSISPIGFANVSDGSESG